MKTYTSEEVIDLVDQYMSDELIDNAVSSFNLDQTKSFYVWLKQKEQSEIPVEGQEIWVRDTIDLTKDGIKIWTQAKFVKFLDNGKTVAIYKNHQLYWDEYNVNNPD